MPTKKSFQLTFSPIPTSTTHSLHRDYTLRRLRPRTFLCLSPSSSPSCLPSSSSSLFSNPPFLADLLNPLPPPPPPPASPPHPHPSSPPPPSSQPSSIH